MPPRRDTFRLWDATFEADAKWRRLRLNTADDYWSAVGAFVVLLSWRTLEGSPGFTRDDAVLYVKPDDLDALIAVGLVGPDGFHPDAWDAWKPRRFPSDEPDATRERKRRSRDVTTGHEPVTNGHDSSTPHHNVTTTSSQGIPSADDPPDALDRYYELTMRQPWGREAGRWTARLEADFGYDRTIAAMDTEWKADPTIGTFLGRVEARLSRDADKAKQRAKAERDRKPKPPSPTARDRRAELQEMMKMVGGPKEGTDEQLRPVQATPPPDRLPRPQRDRPPGT